jgi:hypothetical protein
MKLTSTVPLLVGKNVYKLYSTQQTATCFPVLMNEWNRVSDIWDKVHVHDGLHVMKDLVLDYVGDKAADPAHVHIDCKILQDGDTADHLPRLAVLLDVFYKRKNPSQARKYAIKAYDSRMGNMQPWQHSTYENVMKHLHGDGYMDIMDCWFQSITSPDLLFNNRGQLRRRTADFSIVPSKLSYGCAVYHQQPQTYRIPGALITESTGVGKTRVAVAIARDVTMLPCNDTSRKIIKTVAIVVPPQTLTQWEDEIRVTWPGATVYKLTKMHDFKQLHARLTSNVSQPDILLVSKSVITDNKNTRSRLIAPTELVDGHNYSILRTIQFRACVVDEVHQFLDPPPSTSQKAAMAMPTVGFGARMLTTFFSGRVSILVSATPGLSVPQNIDTYLNIMGAQMSGGEHLIEQPPSTADKLVTGVVPFWAKNIKKLRGIFLHHCVITTGVANIVPVEETSVRYHESSYALNMGLNIFSAYYASQSNASKLVEYFEDKHTRIRNSLVNVSAFAAYGGIWNRNNSRRLLLHLEEDMQNTTSNRLGTIIPVRVDGKELVRGIKFAHHTPVQQASTNVISQLVEYGAKVLVYTELHNMWGGVEDSLNTLNIQVIRFNGSTSSMSKKRKTFDDSVSRTIMFIPSNRTDGTNLPSATHIVVIGKVVDEAHYKQVIGRGTRFGRAGKLQVVHVSGVQCTSGSSLHGLLYRE